MLLPSTGKRRRSAVMVTAKPVLFGLLCLVLGSGCSSGPFDNFWPGPEERVNPTDVTAPTTIQPGTTWTGRNLPNNAFWSALAFGNYSGGVFGSGFFVGVGDSSADAYTSPDGITWTHRNLPFNVDWTKVAYGNNTFVAIVAFNNYNQYAATSP